MGKKRKGYNWKAREVVDVKINDKSQEKVTIELGSSHRGRFDESNAFVLPLKKRKTEVKRHDSCTARFLSKKQRKFYEKVLEKKKKREQRLLLSKELRVVRGPAEVLDKLTSITDVQTKGRKYISDTNAENSENVHNDESSVSTSNGFVKVRLRNLRKENNRKAQIGDHNIVGFETSDSSDSDSDRVSTVKDSDGVPTVKDNALDLTCGGKAILNITTATRSDKQDEDLIGDSNINVPECPEKCFDTKKNDSLKNSLSKSRALSELAKSSHVSAEKSPKVFITVDRDTIIQRTRSKLPIIGEEQRIMEAIHENDIVIISGETGCGKTTQIPQFLYEAGYASNGKVIGITEPRRIAAISMSERVARELNLSTDKVSYLVRFEGNTTPETQIKFMTDGVLMKEIQKDAGLFKYSAIVIDEAHERSVHTDILIGLLTRIVPLRREKYNKPLKLFIMSATLRLSDFTENEKLFKMAIPPVIEIGARQFDVHVHFNKKTTDDYMSAAFKKACKIHTQLPEGGILIFLTGQQEVNTLVKKLREAYPTPKETLKVSRKKKRGHIEAVLSEEESFHDEEDVMKAKPSASSRREITPVVNLDDYCIKPTDEELELSESENDNMENTNVECKRDLHRPMWVLPLYALLPRAKQSRVFEAPPSGYRLCVVATNVAETSLTIPNVKYVIDCGRTKTRVYDQLTGVSAYHITWCSKASADQRAGRAGRTSEGHCYRLYSSAVYEEFQEWDEPEIRRKPIDDVVLMMKASGIDKVAFFPFPSSPDISQLISAEKRLTLLGALEQPRDNVAPGQWVAKITPLGKSMAVYPVAPRFAKMLCLSRDRDILSYMIAIVAALSIQQVLLPPTDEYRKRWRNWVGMGNTLLLGDVTVLLKALGAAECVILADGDIEKFCQTYGLRHKAILEARKLRAQLTNEMNLRVSNLNLKIDPDMPPPSDEQAEQVRQMIMAGMVDHVARKLSKEELKQAHLSFHKAAYRTADMGDIIFLHSSSVLHKLKPEWIVFQEVFKLGEKFYARGITAIEPDWLPIHASLLCNQLEPLKDIAPLYDEQTGRVMCFVSGTFGRSGWQLPVMKVEYPENDDKYKWFAKFFLDGCIFPKLKTYSQHLLGPSDWFFKTWGKHLACKTDNLLKDLNEKKIHSKDKLTLQWQTDPKYLLEAYLIWVPECVHPEVKSLWPPV